MDDGQAAVLALEPEPELEGEPELVELLDPFEEELDPESDFGLLSDVLAVALESDLAPVSAFSVLLSDLSLDSALRSADPPRASERLSLR